DERQSRARPRRRRNALLLSPRSRTVRERAAPRGRERARRPPRPLGRLPADAVQSEPRRRHGSAVRLRLLLLVAVLAAGGASGHAAAPRPNILVIETDDQTVASIRAMPNVGRLLAAHGTTFLNSFVANSLCCPSRATFLTGQYSHSTG